MQKPKAAALGFCFYARLQKLDVFRLQSLRTFGYVEPYRLPFLEATKATRLDGGEMHEDIFAILAGNKAKALGIVKPLHCSLFHCLYLFLFLDVRLEDSA